MAARLPPVLDLTWPSEGSRTVRHLLSLALGRAHAVVAGLAPAGPLDPRTALRAAALEPGALLAGLRRPSRLTLARCLELSPTAPPAARQRWARQLAAWLCLDGAERGLGARATMTDVDELRSEHSGWFVRLPPGARLQLSPHALELTTAHGLGRSPLPAAPDALAAALAPAGVAVVTGQVPLWGEASLLLVDSNPLALEEAHPAKSGNRVDLGGQPVERWLRALGEALAIIAATVPALADEMRLVLGHVGPVGFHAEQHLSASYLEAPGVVYLSLHPHVMTLVEALIHEFQHTKLHLLLGLDPVLHNADRPLYASPVRPDPRPLRGVLLAVHAFEPIGRLHDRLASDPRRAGVDPGAADWHRRRRGEVARMCREGCEVLLPNARPTAAGAGLLAEIAALDAGARGWEPGV